MSRFVIVVALIAFCVTLGFSADTVPTTPAPSAAPAAPVAPMTFGKALTLKDATPIAKLNADPASYKDKDVLIAGKVATVCQMAGCWIEVESADSARILCKATDESIRFPKDCAGSMVQVQGKLVYDPNAKGEAASKEMKGGKHKAKGAKAEKTEGATCPTSKVIVGITGAELMMVSSADKKAALDEKKAALDENKAALDAKKAALDEKKAAVDEKKAAVDEKKAAQDENKAATGDKKDNGKK